MMESRNLPANRMERAQIVIIAVAFLSLLSIIHSNNDIKCATPAGLFDERKVSTIQQPKDEVHPEPTQKIDSKRNHSINGPKAIEWIRPSPLELDQIKASNKKSCRNPFQHCCLGQCRQERLRIDVNESFWKPVVRNETQKDLHSFSDVIDVYGATQNRGNDKACTIAFGGDSLSSDHSMGAVCSLMEDGFELKSCNPAIGGPAYGADVNVTCDQNKHPDKPHFLLENKDHPTCSQVLILFIPNGISPDRFQSWFRQDRNGWGGLVIFNWGAHCNSKHNIQKCMSKELRPYLELAKDDAVTQRWTFIYRETEPQHFNIPGGVYFPNPNKTFFQCSRFQGNADNFRNEFALQFFQQHNLSLATIPIFSALEPLTHLHVDGDCTHYCYNPMRFWVTWEGLYNALKTNHNNS